MLSVRVSRPFVGMRRDELVEVYRELSVRVFLCVAIAEHKNVSRTLTENEKPRAKNQKLKTKNQKSNRQCESPDLSSGCVVLSLLKHIENLTENREQSDELLTRQYPSAIGT